MAITALGNLRDAAAETILARLLDQLLARELPPEVHLDVLTAAAKHETAAIPDNSCHFTASIGTTRHAGDSP